CRRRGPGAGPPEGRRRRGGPVRAGPGTPALCGGEGVGGGRRGQPDRGRGRTRLVRGRPGPPHPGGHHPGGAPPRGPGAAGGGRDRQVRGAAGGGEGEPMTAFASVQDGVAGGATRDPESKTV